MPAYRSSPVLVLLFSSSFFLLNPVSAGAVESRGYVEIRMPDEFVSAKMADGSVYITASKIEAEFKKQCRNMKDLFTNKKIDNFIVSDKRYLLITDKWFKELVGWTREFFIQQAPELASRET